ncbi:MAG: glycoside hydrolase N-terminal domain-containing protein [Lachnospiraceae bacterium]|nr:glycoside hydrolase N-terminal domain-containing protein [Lachnospiraceae bacterium]
MKYEIKSKKKADNWEEGYFTGDGTVGAIVMCCPGQEQIILNHESLFLHATEWEAFPEMADVFGELRKSYESGEQISYAEKFYQTARERGLKNKILKEDTTLYPDSYFPAFEVWVDYEEGRGKVHGEKNEIGPSRYESNYERSLNTRTSEIRSHFGEGKNQVTERVFTSRVKNAVIACFQVEEERDFEITVRLSSAKNEFEERLKETCITDVKLAWNEEGNELSVRVGMNQGFYTGCLTFRTDGTALLRDGALRIGGARTVAFAVTIGVNEEAKRPGAVDYESWYQENLPVYREQFDRTSIELMPNPWFDADMEELFERMREKEKKREAEACFHALMQKMYYAGRYYAISSFGKLPPNAQGLWSGNVNGRLMCDYVSNIELEMAFWAVFSGNFAEKALPCFEFIDSLIPDFEENARKFFGARGIMITSRFTNSGLAFHFSPGFTHEFWIAGGAWIAQFYYDYYLYTQDEQFLRERALPFMQKAALFYMDYVAEGEVIPSVSPENSPYEAVFCMAGKNAAMDIAAIRELFENIEAACRRLHLPNEYRITLRDYAYTEDGTLKEWADDNAADAYAHRHISQVYAAMPGTEARKDKRLEAGIRKAIDKRIENGFYEEPNGTCGWSVMHLINTYARLGDRAGYDTAMRFFFEHYVRENLTSCLTYSTNLYQIDANLGYVNALYEMLVYSTEEEIVLLPCLPNTVSDIRAENLLLKKNRIIRSLCVGKESVTADIWSSGEGEVMIRLGETAGLGTAEPSKERDCQESSEKLVAFTKESIQRVTFVRK